MAHYRPPPSASILFEKAELAEYKRWLGLNYRVNVFGTTTVPTAFELADFQEWRKEQHEREAPSRRSSIPDLPEPEQDDAGFELAETCKHALHPVHAQDLATEEGEVIEEGEQWCPVCIYQHHQTLVDALYTNWTVMGGPWHTGTLDSNVQRIIYSDTGRAHQKARVALINTIPEFEDMAREEKDWNLAHPEQDVDVPMTHSATKVLEMYHKSLNIPAHLTDVEAPQTPANKRLKKDKKLEYSPDTPKETRNRPQSYWARKMASHDPNSPHACSSPEGHLDTSHFHDWHFCVSQCRILLCYYVDAETVELHYHDLNDGADKGLDNPHVKRLIEVLEKHMAMETNENQVKWLAYLKDTSDIFLVWNGSSMKNNGDGAFTTFDHIESLMGSQVEKYARMKGDIDDEEWAARELNADDEPDVWEEEDEGGQAEHDEEGEEEGEQDVSYEQMSVGSDSESDNEIVKMELADPMDVEEADDQ